MSNENTWKIESFEAGSLSTAAPQDYKRPVSERARDGPPGWRVLATVVRSAPASTPTGALRDAPAVEGGESAAFAGDVMRPANPSRFHRRSLKPGGGSCCYRAAEVGDACALATGCSTRPLTGWTASRDPYALILLRLTEATHRPRSLRASCGSRRPSTSGRWSSVSFPLNRGR